MLHKFFNKKSATVNAEKSASQKEIRINSEKQQLADELHKPIIKRF